VFEGRVGKGREGRELHVCEEERMKRSVDALQYR